MPPTFTLLPVSNSDGPVLIRTQHEGFLTDSFRRASFPHVPLELSIKDSISRWPANFSASGSIYMKSLDNETGEIIGYSKWDADAALVQKLKEEFGTHEAVESSDDLDRRDPVGLNVELAEEMSGSVVACRNTVLGDRPRILLSLLCTLPAYRGKGVATEHLAWATKLADKANLPIWLDASPISVPLYEKFGFVAVGKVESDLSLGSKGAENGTYIHTCMLREPCTVQD